MSKNLVIVESPAKAKTIEKYLGSDFKVFSSYGHISDLPSKELGVDVDNDFKPKYIIPKDKKDVVRELKKKALAADFVWLASDEDREGEAIAWHLFESLKLDKDKTKRIVFREITKSAILKAIDNPREINYNLVNAQQARRVIDRLVGFEISPILWRKVKGGLSAGRVQSVAVRLLVDREKEINDFTPISSFKVLARFKNSNNAEFTAQHVGSFSSLEEVNRFLEKSINSNFSILSIDKTPFKKSASAPFTTSTLQQEASRKLGFNVSRTMLAAQRLYESGNITYMRTDSVNLSDDALKSIEAVIKNNYGEQYSRRKKFQNKNKGAQEAHEAIRPTNFENKEVNMEFDQSKLYKLIWLRTVASQMSDAILERTTFKIASNNYNNEFSSNGEVIKFDGFLKLYIDGVDNNDEEENSGILPALSQGESLNNLKMIASEKFSRPLYRYSEAALVKKLEELGIGRPSTYAPTITTIQNRKYVVKGSFEGNEREYRELVLQNGSIQSKTSKEITGSDKGKLVPTEVGIIVTEFLVNNFQNILNYNFTASVEEDFDKIANGEKEWTNILKDFYSSFHPIVEDVIKNASRESGERILGTDPVSGRKVSVRLGKFGPMAQIGSVDEEDKPIFAGLLPEQKISKITLEETLELFKLPCYVGDFENEKIESNTGRYGPYIKHNNLFVSLPKGLNPLQISLDQAIELILEKRRADAPISNYEGHDVSKGKGRFGPFIKWKGLFINVNKSYDFDNLSQEDCVNLIEDKKKKEAEKLVRIWEDEGIRIEKARWGRFNVIKGKFKVELPKGTDVDKFTIDDVKILFQKKKKKKSSFKSKK
ncbi:MAG: type I DNA topoisomerase [Flavobacteriaceae bacterium]|jgi:DNA topoisomerase-1|nr:type I DNA topoisomerase [Flavobacteriaceae bacterium]MBT5012185.1 type I DNA topoisomerase [Flavobacteriaceae bacterium]MBT5395969.1 type I DNA topoisomerase [Flavobacteriaceae bacterium]MBT7010917.1 type I DNA topoisomerase [Flavobacteriaceae bacterium]MBT7553767.1 type I DNA topoisomerase [Flavobacteriaceae bacterium]